MSTLERCSCCGLPIAGQCLMCTICDGWHGDRLEQRIIADVSAGRIAPQIALVRMVLDDAHYAGMLVALVREETMVADLWIPRPAPRWRALVGRAIGMAQPPDLTLIINAVLAPHLPAYPTDDKLRAVERDLTEALAFIDPNCVSVDIKMTRDVLAPEHMLFNITMRTADAPFTVTPPGVDTEIPADILARPRGQA